jgi:hypothetical protein
LEKDRTYGPTNGVLPQGAERRQLSAIVSRIQCQYKDWLQMARTLFRARV